MVKTELDKNKAMGTTWHLEFPDGTECQARYNYTLPEPYGEQYIYEEARAGHVFFSTTCGWIEIPILICLKLGIQPPQSPEAPQAAGCIVKNDTSDMRNAKAITMLTHRRNAQR